MKIKSVNQSLIAGISILALFLSLSAFVAIDGNKELKPETDLADYSCTLYVKTSNGSAAKSIKVSTDVSGGISCSGGRSFYTDSNGMVTLKWVSGCYLKKVFVDGRGYDVDYKNGETYYLTMK